jgi:hypothetical protein
MSLGTDAEKNIKNKMKHLAQRNRDRWGRASWLSFGQSAMSLSREDRIANFNLTLAHMVEAVGEQSYSLVLITPSSDAYGDTYPTTWIELESKCYIASVLGGHSRQLTGLGWLRGMEVLGKKDDAEFQSRLGMLCAQLKSHVNGRQQVAVVSVANVARDSGLPIGLVHNIVDAGLIDAWQQRQGPKWAIRGQLISIPADFGLEFL